MTNGFTEPRRALVATNWRTSRDKQLALPAGWFADGSGWASLAEVLAGDKKTIDFSDLDEKKQAQITAIRIGKQRRFMMAVLGFHTVDSRRAVDEVLGLTSIGLALIGIEERMIRFVKAKYTSGPDFH